MSPNEGDANEMAIDDCFNGDENNSLASAADNHASINVSTIGSVSTMAGLTCTTSASQLLTLQQRQRLSDCNGNDRHHHHRRLSDGDTGRYSDAKPSDQASFLQLVHDGASSQGAASAHMTHDIYDDASIAVMTPRNEKGQHKKHRRKQRVVAGNRPSTCHRSRDRSDRRVVDRSSRRESSRRSDHQTTADEEDQLFYDNDTTASSSSSSSSANCKHNHEQHSKSTNRSKSKHRHHSRSSSRHDRRQYGDNASIAETLLSNPSELPFALKRTLFRGQNLIMVLMAAAMIVVVHDNLKFYYYGATVGGDNMSLDENRRALSTSLDLGGGKCKWQPPTYDVPDNIDFYKTLIAGFPSGDKRMVW